MCGRFVASRPVEDIAAIMDVDDVEVPEELLPRFNISPQAGVLAIANRRVRQPADQEPPPDVRAGDPVFRRRLTVYHWGLVPSWAKDPSVGNRSFNSRAETLAERPAFRTALAKRRCLIPADAFYEWQKVPSGSASSSVAGDVRTPKGGGRLPWCFRPADGGLLVFAGLWEAWRAAGPGDGSVGNHHDEASGWHDDWLLSCSIITTSANDIVATVHDRMPVVLQPADWASWLEPTPLDPAELGGLLSPPPTGYLTGYRVAPDVNNSRLDDPSMVEPLGASTEESAGHEANTLFDLPFDQIA